MPEHLTVMHMLYNHDYAVKCTWAIEALTSAITGESIGHPQHAKIGSYVVCLEGNDMMVYR